MMKAPFIQKREKTDNYYQELQAQTLERLAELSGNIWTDFNVHDPGITISDYLNYALYDLHYRLQFDFDAYLFGEGEQGNYSKKGLFTRNELFLEDYIFHGEKQARKSIVTEADYEQLILHAYSSQVFKCRVRLNESTWKYDVFLKLKAGQDDEESNKKLIESVRQTYHMHRNIGEDLGMIFLDDSWQNQDKGYKRRRHQGKNTYEMPTFDAVSEAVEVKPFSPAYHSIQYDFPENYGISERGIPNKNDTETYEAKVMQLKAYLLIFDFLLADHLQQAGNAAELLDLSPLLPADRLPEVIITDGERIIDTSRKEVQEMREKDFFPKQKFRFLNMLDMLYGEDTRSIFGKSDLSRLNEKRAGLLQSLPKTNEYRFRSFNIHEPNSISVIQQLMETVLEEQLGSYFTHNRHDMKVTTDEDFFERYRFLLNLNFEHITDTSRFHEVPQLELEYADNTYDVLRMYMNLVWHGVVFESFLKYGTDPANYKILSFPEKTEYLLIFFHPEKKVGINMSLFFSEKEKLEELANLFWKLIHKINREGYQQHFYMVEHLLLTENKTNETDLVSIVVPKLSNRTEKHFELCLRERLPAHLRINLFYLPSNALENFHDLYFCWRKALAANSEDKNNRYSNDLNGFLDHHRQQNLSKEI